VCTLDMDGLPFDQRIIPLRLKAPGTIERQ
jgi:hypothetical protein